MIKFFRKIRQNLLSEGKTGKYFKYAIGEIFLVVIGILIALQINTWNNDKINDRKQIEILKNLLSEFQSNQMQLNDVISDYEWNYQSAAFLSQNFSDSLKYLTNVQLDSLIGGIMYIPEYYPTTSVMDLVVSTGQIQLIKNDSLRLAITLNNGLMPLYKMTARRAENVMFDNIYPKLENHYPIKNIHGGRLTNFGEFRNTDFVYENLTIFKDASFENALEVRRVTAFDILETANMIHSSQAIVISMINEELKEYK